MWFPQVFAKWKQILVIPQSFASLLMMSCTFIAMHQNYKVHLLVLHPGKQKCIWLRCSCLTSIHSLNRGKNKENWVTKKKIIGHWVTFSLLLSIVCFFHQHKNVHAAIYNVNDRWEAHTWFTLYICERDPFSNICMWFTCTGNWVPIYFSFDSF